MPSAFRLGSRSIALIVSFASLVIVGGLAFWIPVPYVTMSPGPTFDTLGKVGDSEMFTFGDDVETFPTDGRLDFTSVSVTRAETSVTMLTALEAWWDKDTIVVPRDFIYPDEQTNDVADQQGAVQLSRSQDASRVAALRAVGMTVPESVVVDDVVAKAPADGVLKKDDVILAVDGEKVTNVQTAANAIADRQPGDDVVLNIVRKGKPRDVTISTTENPDDPKRARVGINVGTKFDFPIEIENHIGDRVGGPSAGLMFALGMYDQLTPGSLTGGTNIAGTGSISPSGEVGTVGGIAQKMAGAEDAGASVFLVPADNCGEAITARDFNMTVVKVTKLDDAISSLEALKKNPKAKVPSC